MFIFPSDLEQSTMIPTWSWQLRAGLAVNLSELEATDPYDFPITYEGGSLRSFCPKSSRDSRSQRRRHISRTAPEYLIGHRIPYEVTYNRCACPRNHTPSTLATKIFIFMHRVAAVRPPDWNSDHHDLSLGAASPRRIKRDLPHLLHARFPNSPVG